MGLARPPLLLPARAEVWRRTRRRASLDENVGLAQSRAGLARLLARAASTPLRPANSPRDENRGGIRLPSPPRTLTVPLARCGARSGLGGRRAHWRRTRAHRNATGTPAIAVDAGFMLFEAAQASLGLLSDDRTTLGWLYVLDNDRWTTVQVRRRVFVRLHPPRLCHSSHDVLLLEIRQRDSQDEIPA